jgi:hypothetical protein
MNHQNSDSDSDSMAAKVFVGLENEDHPTQIVKKNRVGKNEVYKAFMNKAINTYFTMRFECGNPKFKQVVTTIPMFRNLSILAKDYLVDNFSIISMKNTDIHPIVDLTTMDFFFCMEGRISLIFKTLEIDSGPKPGEKMNETQTTQKTMRSDKI